MNKDKLDSMLYSRVDPTNDGDLASNYNNHYLEQYRIYLNIFNSANDRRNKSNEFFLGLNTAIIGVLGFLESKDPINNNSIIFLFAPLVGVAICFCWYQIIISHKQLSRAKYGVIHYMEEKLPLSLFKKEWELLGEGKDYSKYRTLTSIEKNIPIIFIVLYSVTLGMKLPWDLVSLLFK